MMLNCCQLSYCCCYLLIFTTIIVASAAISFDRLRWATDLLSRFQTSGPDAMQACVTFQQPLCVQSNDFTTSAIGGMDRNNGSYRGIMELSLPFIRVAGKAATLLVGATLSVMPPCLVMASQSLSPPVKGKQVLDGEVSRIFLKARRLESEGDFQEAQRLYEEVISVEPTFIYSWANLGNVLVSEGTLNQALLCYKKAISLQPPKEQLGVILLNKASLELSIGDPSIATSAWHIWLQSTCCNPFRAVGDSIQALKDLDKAEKISGSSPSILTNKAVALSNNGDWEASCALFERVISSGDRDALPWWLRYAMSLLETSRSTEAVAYLQRTLNRFPNEAECKVFASALYTELGLQREASTYWLQLSADDRELYSVQFVRDRLHWGPRAVRSYEQFLSTQGSRTGIQL